MSDSIDRILAVVDGGLQRSAEGGLDGGNPSRCWRCRVMDPAEGSTSGLCTPCRAFLLDEGPDPLRSDGLIAYIDAELFEALQTRLFEGDGTGVPTGIVIDHARLRIAVEDIVAAVRPVLERIAQAIADFLASIDWSAIGRLVDDLEEARRDVLARRTLPEGRRRGRPTRPPRDLRATEAPRVAPDPRRKTP